MQRVAHQRYGAVNPIVTGVRIEQGTMVVPLLGSPAKKQAVAATMPDRLSHREQAVPTCLCHALSNKAIALTLHISPRTDQKHLPRVFQQSDAHTRTEAIVQMRALGDAPPRLASKWNPEGPTRTTQCYVVIH